MKVLYVCSVNKGLLSPFVKEQIDSIARLGVEVSLFKISKKGTLGYLSFLQPLKQYIRIFNPDLIHAHYGLSGLLANFQRKVPVVTTFHGTDINNKMVYLLSRWAHILNNTSIFVSENMKKKVPEKNECYTIPCGVDLSVFYPVLSDQICHSDVFNRECYNILFSSAFSNPVKNYILAKNACEQAEKFLNKKINLIELKGYSRTEVNMLMNASDCLILTSFSEGSPQFIKEAMVCNKPIVATNVGDIEWLFGATKGCYLTSFDPIDIANKIITAIEFSSKKMHTNGRERIIELGLDSETVARKIRELYMNIL